MAWRIIPLKGSALAPTITQRVVLDGAQYLFELQWNGREGRWFLHLLDAGGSPIELGMKLVANARLGARCRDPRMPAGVLFLHASSGRDPGLDELRDVTLAYLDAADVQTVAAPRFVGAVPS